MDRLKPNDIERTEFKVRFRGYDRNQVHELLTAAADELARLLEQVEQQESAIGGLKKEIEAFHEQDRLMKETLMLAQRASDDARDAAHREAARIIAAAQERADETAKDARQTISNLKWDIEKLRLEKQRFVQAFKTMLEGHLRELAESSRNLSVIEGEAASDDVAQA